MFQEINHLNDQDDIKKNLTKVRKDHIKNIIDRADEIIK